MALSTTTLSNPVGTTIYIDADANSTVEVAASTGKTAYQLYINNLGNGNPCFIQLVAATSATSGTTDSTFRFYCPGDSTISYVLPTGLAFAFGQQQQALQLRITFLRPLQERLSEIQLLPLML